MVCYAVYSNWGVCVCAGTQLEMQTSVCIIIACWMCLCVFNKVQNWLISFWSFGRQFTPVHYSNAHTFYYRMWSLILLLWNFHALSLPDTPTTLVIAIYQSVKSSAEHGLSEFSFRMAKSQLIEDFPAETCVKSNREKCAAVDKFL